VVKNLTAEIESLKRQPALDGLEALVANANSTLALTGRLAQAMANANNWKRMLDSVIH
jgi:hypothetical protein